AVATEGVALEFHVASGPAAVTAVLPNLRSVYPKVGPDGASKDRGWARRVVQDPARIRCGLARLVFQCVCTDDERRVRRSTQHLNESGAARTDRKVRDAERLDEE